jgi:hypothetical protein
MSYCYDVMSRVWVTAIRPYVPNDALAFRFEVLIEAMHSANHRLGDGINHDAEVSKVARALDAELVKAKAGQDDDQVWDALARMCERHAESHRRGGSSEQVVNACLKLAGMIRDPAQRAHALVS